MTDAYTDVEREFVDLSAQRDVLRAVRNDYLAGVRFALTDEERRAAAEKAEAMLLSIGELTRRIEELKPQYLKDRDARFARDLEADSDKDAG